MSTTTKNCDECAHFNPDVLYDECPCDKEHRARFYKPRGPLDTDYGWKRKCADFREKTPNGAVIRLVEETMKAAYADPPYLGCGAKHYGDRHEAAADYDTPEAHKRADRAPLRRVRHMGTGAEDMSTTQHPEALRDARWYMVNKDGMATLCTDKADAEKEAADAQSVWPHMGPHRAVQLVEAADVEAMRAGYAAARLDIESLQARIKTMSEERSDELMVAHLDGRSQAAQPAERKQMTYETNPRNVLPNGLTLLQVNPDCAARLDPGARDHGWLYIKGADGQWVTHRKLADAEIEEAYDQAADMAVKHGTKVRAG